MRTIEEYYDGVNIVPDGSVSLLKGQRVMIYVLDEKPPEKRRNIDFSRYVGRGGRMLDMDAQEYVNGLRDNDRI
ncbi:MAG: hypothetical protein IJT94_15825 [Oscillibacter sp.]|nr:hypothetical protein [Oscillibacter sp.]